jgi:prevent-host-death family protein
MTSVALEIAQKELGDLIETVKLGGHILITQGSKPVAEIVPIQRGKSKPKFGSAKGLITMSKDFDAPLPDFDEYTK